MHPVYFVRHGESEWNVADRICGQTDVALTRIKNTSVFVLIDSAGRTGVVLLCCGISIRKSEEKGIEGKLSWN